MADFIYIAKRSIQSGHTVDTEYTVTTNLSQLDRQPKPITKTNKALSGVEGTILHRLEIHWMTATALINQVGGALDGEDMREFLDSVIGGEPFTFNNGSDVTMKLERGYKENRHDPLYYRYSFTMREV